MNAIMTSPEATKVKAHHWQQKLMGCHFVISAIDVFPDRAWAGIRSAVSEIQRIEKMISSWSVDSYTHQINEKSGICPVEVPAELYHLIERSIRISDLTAGAFDISGTLARYYWSFDKQEGKMLSNAKIQELRDLINYRNIVLNEKDNSIFLIKEGMKIGFGGIGKGYAAYRASVVMKELGIKGGLINASGDLMCWGQPPNRSDWDIHIPDPKDRIKSKLQISIPDGSVVTSGNFEFYTMINGIRYSHIVDPRTGLPVRDISAVSVICPNPELADALATAISVLGWEDGIGLVDKMNGVECIITNNDDHTYYSHGIAA